MGLNGELLKTILNFKEMIDIYFSMKLCKDKKKKKKDLKNKKFFFFYSTQRRAVFWTINTVPYSRARTALGFNSDLIVQPYHSRFSLAMFLLYFRSLSIKDQGESRR